MATHTTGTMVRTQSSSGERVHPNFGWNSTLTSCRRLQSQRRMSSKSMRERSLCWPRRYDPFSISVVILESRCPLHFVRCFLCLIAWFLWIQFQSRCAIPLIVRYPRVEDVLQILSYPFSVQVFHSPFTIFQCSRSIVESTITVDMNF